jgi:hypothetical protein
LSALSINAPVAINSTGSVAKNAKPEELFPGTGGTEARPTPNLQARLLKACSARQIISKGDIVRRRFIFQISPLIF